MESVGLGARKNRASAALSHGDRKVLEIAIALGGKPKFLILDEPTAGMSPEETAHCIDLIKKLSKEFGLTILFCEHDMEIVFAIANRIMVMVRGATIVQGVCAEVRCNQAVQDAYLGGSESHAECQGIHTYYGLSHILFDVSLEVSKGEIVGLLGRNGAGKSTTMRSIAGLTPPKQGPSPSTDNRLRATLTIIVRQGIAYVPDDRRVFADLSVDDNLEITYGATTTGTKRRSMDSSLPSGRSRTAGPDT